MYSYQIFVCVYSCSYFCTTTDVIVVNLTELALIRWMDALHNISPWMGNAIIWIPWCIPRIG